MANTPTVQQQTGNTKPVPRNSHIYNNPNLDPDFRRGQNLAIKKAREKYQAQKIEFGKSIKQRESTQKPDAFKIMSEEYFRFMNDFAEKNPEKAKKYAYAKGYENPALQTTLTVRAASPNSKDQTDEMVRYFQSSIDASRKYIPGSKDGLKVKQAIESFLPKVTDSKFTLWVTQPPTANIEYFTQFLDSEIIKPTIRKVRDTRIGRYVEKKITPFVKNNFTPTVQLNPASSYVAKKAKAYLGLLNNAYLRQYLENPRVQRLSKKLGLDKESLRPKNLFRPNSLTRKSAQKLQNAGKTITSNAKPITERASQAAGKLGLTQNPFQLNSFSSQALKRGGYTFRAAARPLNRPAGMIWNATSGNPFGLNRFSKKGKATIQRTGKKAAEKLASKAVKQTVTTAARALFANPPVLIGTAIVSLGIIFFLAIMISILGGGGDLELSDDFGIGGGSPGGGRDPGDLEKPRESAPIPGLTLSKTAQPTQLDTPGKITYSISFTFFPPTTSSIKLENITIYDDLPPNTVLLKEETTGNFDMDATGRQIAWPLLDPENQSPLTLVVLADARSNNTDVSNFAYATALSPGDGIIDASSADLAQIFQQSAQKAKIPLPMLKAIAKKESGVLSYTNDDVSQFNTIDWFAGRVDNAPTSEENDPLIVKGYAYNTCLYVPCFAGADVRGAMQFEINTWNGIKPLLSFADGHDPDRRYVRDVIFGAGEFIAGKARDYDSRYNFSTSPNDWNEKQVRALARTYCGGNPDADVANDGACTPPGGVPYDILVWQYYQEFKAILGS